MPKEARAKRVLKMTLQREWFDEIRRGVKKIEYREIKPYWRTRIEGRQYDEIFFRNGYNPDSPTMRVEYLGYDIDRAGGYYELKLGKVLEVRGV